MGLVRLGQLAVQSVLRIHKPTACASAKEDMFVKRSGSSGLQATRV